jgi:hypothetical protein
METNDNPKPKRKLELKKDVITILQSNQMAKIIGGNMPDDLNTTLCSDADTCSTHCGGKKCVGNAD